MGEVDPDLAPVGPGDREHRLAVDGDAAGLLPGAPVDQQQLVAADRGQEQQLAGLGPALEVRHLVDRQRLLALAVAVEDAPHAGWSRSHRSSSGQPVLAEQAGDVVAAVAGDQPS